MNPLGFNPQMLQGIQQVKGLVSQLNMMKNPQVAMQQMAQSNPQLNQVLQMCQCRNPKDVFYSVCQQRGIDPEQFIQMLK